MSSPPTTSLPVKGGRMLLYAGLGLAALVLFSALAVRPLTPRTFFIDEGRLFVCDGYLSPKTALNAINRPLKENDIIAQAGNDLPGSDRIYTINRAKTVTIADAGKNWTVSSTAESLKELVTGSPDKFNLSKLDRVVPSLNSPIKDGMKVSIVRVTVKEETKEEKIEPPYNIVKDSILPRGKLVTVKSGQPGLAKVTYRKYYKNGKLATSQKLSSTVLKQPVPGTKKIGERVLIMSRSGYRGKRVLEMEATAYDSGPSSTGRAFDNVTATGAKAEYGIVAVDPRVIPLGTKLFIEGYGYAVAKDVGGAIKGLRIDLFFESHKEAIQFGRRHVKVYVVD
jgi:3D (Asp-Asp-Asp) domain-containing protein